MMTLFLPLLAAVSLATAPSESLQRLLQGNQRYVKNLMEGPNRTPERREQISQKQQPFAVIVGCSDSRVAPEILFDQGLGDIFVVRVAGNVVGPTEIDSIDYAVRYLGASLVLVFGHEGCGAVSAVMEGTTADIEDVAALIKPAIQGAKTLEEAIQANVRSVVAQLKQTELLRKFKKQGKVDCVGAYYHLSSGKIELISTSP